MDEKFEILLANVIDNDIYYQEHEREAVLEQIDLFEDEN